MMTVTLEMFANSVELDRLCYYRQAKPIGKVDASSTLQWVATDTRLKVVRIGLVVKDKVRL